MKKKGEKVLITGGAGYIGCVLTKRLLDENYRVTCLDNLMYRQDQAILPFASNPNFEFVHADARDERILKNHVPTSDIIIPLSAIVGAPACEKHPIEAETVNRDAVILLEGMRSSQQKLVFPNTNSGYGTKSGEYHCNEDTPMEPISLYGRTKCDAEKSIAESGKDYVVFRLASVFGVSPRMRLDLSFHKMLMQAMTKKAIVLSEGNFTRNYIYIGDVSRAFTFAIENYENMKGHAYNTGSDSANICKMDLAKKIANHVSAIKIYENDNEQDPDKRNYLVSNDKLRKAGFKAEISIDQGIEEVRKGLEIMLSNNPYENI